MATIPEPSGGYLLRPLDPVRDGASLHAIFGDEESCRFMSSPASKSVEETVDLLSRWMNGVEETSWAVAQTESGPALGRISLIPRGRDIFEAACMITPAARGHNLAQRLLAPAIDHVFATMGARRIFADIDPDNTPSIRTFTYLGFQYEGRLRAAWKTHIGVRDSIIMGLTDSDPRPWKSPPRPRSRARSAPRKAKPATSAPGGEGSN
jgi:RimJ/RimL family protein N-acetyltransferase